MPRVTARANPDWLVVSVGCPCGIGPEVSVRAAAKVAGTVLVGDFDMLQEAAELVRVPQKRLLKFEGEIRDPRAIYVHSVGPKLSARDRKAGKPNAASDTLPFTVTNRASLPKLSGAVTVAQDAQGGIGGGTSGGGAPGIGGDASSTLDETFVSTGALDATAMANSALPAAIRASSPRERVDPCTTPRPRQHSTTAAVPIDAIRSVPLIAPQRTGANGRPR